MKYLKRFKFSLLALLLLIVVFTSYFLKQKNLPIDCNPLMQKFDEYMMRSRFPAMSSGALCYGLNLGAGREFKEPEPKRAIGKLIFENGIFIFKGVERT